MPGPHADPLAAFRDLPRGSASPLFVAEGVLAVERLLASEFDVEALVCTPAAHARLAPLLAATPVAATVLPKAELAAVAGFAFHRGVLACGRRPAPHRCLNPGQLDSLRARERLTIVAAERLADPRNLGALIRNAAAFGADLLIADLRGADPFSRLAIRASVGEVFRLPVLISPELGATLRELSEALALELVASSPRAPTCLREFVRPAKLAVLVGNEGEGLSQTLAADADHRVRIPIAGATDSLNVAAATAVLLYALSP